MKLQLMMILILCLFRKIKEIKLIREQKVDGNYIDWLVNTNGETMEYNGQTYYK